MSSNAVPGPILQAKICVENWNEEGDYHELDCGTFEIDSVVFSGPPDKVTIKAVATPIASSIRRQEKTRGWEDTTLENIAQDIAGDAGLELMYEVESDIELDRVDQNKQPDMAFLMDLCSRYGVALKATNKKIVLFEESAYEQRPVVASFDKAELDGRIISYTFSQNTSDTACSAKNSYKDPKAGRLAEAEFVPPNPPATGQQLILNVRPGDLRGDNFRECNDTASGSPGGTFDTGFSPYNDTNEDFDAIRADVTDNTMRIVKGACRQKNKWEWQADIKLRGNISIVGGVNIELTGFGIYSGTYAVQDATHNVGGGYTTDIKATRILEGY